MDKHEIIPMFSNLWWIGLIVSIILVIGILKAANKLSEVNEKRFRWLISILIFLRETLWHFFLYQYGDWEVAESLPLHLCGISRIFGAILLIYPRQLLFEYLILLGMAGAVQSYVTPELTHGISPFLIFDFYFSHGIIIFMALYAFFVLKMSMYKWSWLRAFIFGNAILAVVGTINYFINGNYIYLCQRPLAENPLIMGEWPWYIIGFQIAALIHILLFYLIFTYLQKNRLK
jgi:hypothetical integral membrane protein (TIGR02206 family)